MQRKILGLLAILFLLSGLVLLRWSGYHLTGGSSAADHEGAMYAGSMMLRIGIALGALWLALPSRADQISWSQTLARAGAIVLGIFLLTRLKAVIVVRLLPWLAGIGLLIYLLRPRPRGRRPRP